ncbi:hypothetical protein IQ31_01029 [Sphingobacterium siyangense]|uniref:Uncharacterized protein n=1 Tax=Sphingobacterium siyangense TaxID=459529 RepID=A0A562MWN4_9SPHI|nr:hypothetical protein IQ31_01029 [Sphingobacterium siyangense]
MDIQLMFDSFFLVYVVWSYLLKYHFNEKNFYDFMFVDFSR